MNTFKHVGSTWLLAQLLHPFLFYFYFFLQNDALGINDLLPLFTASFVLSIPSLILASFFIQMLPVMRLSIGGNLFAWLVLAGASVAVNIALLALLIGEPNMLLTEWQLFVSPFLAAWVSIFIRYRQFQIFIIAQTLEHEN